MPHCLKAAERGFEPSLFSARAGAPPPRVRRMPASNWDVRPSQVFPSEVWGNPVPRGLSWIRRGTPRAELSSSFFIFQHLPEHLLCADLQKTSESRTRPTSGSSSSRSPWRNGALIWGVRLILAVQFSAGDFTSQRLSLSLLNGALTPSSKGCSEDLTKILL